MLGSGDSLLLTELVVATSAVASSPSVVLPADNSATLAALDGASVSPEEDTLAAATSDDQLLQPLVESDTSGQANAVDDAMADLFGTLGNASLGMDLGLLV